ncbi:SgcJ/EcaC family oxidoreductase [Chryseolinea sp. T2]|uniref:SgcJ/EcaC family oxidoreductase n=1 Tax=Chryseolinea sp. T2 TaxID=3129255 RepID=UPI003077160B
MKNPCALTAFMLLAFSACAQSVPTAKQRQDIHALIDKYSEAREKKDTILLKSILTDDIDQLVSTGEWRNGIQSSVTGMLKSSAASPGTRTLTIDKIRMIAPAAAIVDCKYEIANADGTPRKMWSTFVVVDEKRVWKISAIRNMLPGKP